jgi:frataxin
MVRTSILEVARLSSRNVRHSSSQRSFMTARQSIAAHPQSASLSHAFAAASMGSSRLFATTAQPPKGISTDSANPQTKAADHAAAAPSATEISIGEYHQISDEYMDNILAKLEHLQEAREDVDVEFSVCALFALSLWRTLFHSITHHSHQFFLNYGRILC